MTLKDLKISVEPFEEGISGVFLSRCDDVSFLTSSEILSGAERFLLGPPMAGTT